MSAITCLCLPAASNPNEIALSGGLSDCSFNIVKSLKLSDGFVGIVN